MAKVRRKRDGNLYHTNLVPTERPGYAHWGPCYRLVPVWEGVTHYKGVEATKKQFTMSDGSPIQ